MLMPGHLQGPTYVGKQILALLAYVNLGSSFSNLSCDRTAKGASHKALAASEISRSSKIGLHATQRRNSGRRAPILIPVGFL